MLGSMLHGYPSVPIASQKGEEKWQKDLSEKKEKSGTIDFMLRMKAEISSRRNLPALKANLKPRSF